MRSMFRWLVAIGALVALAFSASATAVANEVDAESENAAMGRAAVSQVAGIEPQACGFIGGETYRHCDSRTHVLIDATNIWGTTYRNICVGPGDTHLGHISDWVISYAWYIGKTC